MMNPTGKIVVPPTINPAVTVHIAYQKLKICKKKYFNGLGRGKG